MSSEDTGHTPAGRNRGWVTFCLLLSGLLVVFPIGWLGEAWPGVGRMLGGVFATAGAHAVGHILLFLMLGLSALAVFPALRQRPQAYFGWLFLAAVLQEALQLLYKRRRVVFDDVRDLATDLIGLALAFLIARYLLPLLKPAS